MKAKKVMALVLCAAMVSGLAATTVMAAPEDQFDGLTANEAYEFPMMVKSFQSTYWEAAMPAIAIYQPAVSNLFRPNVYMHHPIAITATANQIAPKIESSFSFFVISSFGAWATVFSTVVFSSFFGIFCLEAESAPTVF